MKHPKNKSFGRPVLTEEKGGSSADYPDISFQVELAPVAAAESSTEVKLRYEMDAPVKAIQEKIKSGEAGYFLQTECRKTYFSQTTAIGSDGKGTETFSTSDLSGRIECSCFVLTKKKTGIDLVPDEQLHPEFQRNTFHYEEGAVLAYSDLKKFNVTPPQGDIFELVGAENVEKDAFEVRFEDANASKVRLCFHPDQLEKAKALPDKQPSGQEIFTSSVLIPAIVLMVTSMKEKRDKELRGDKRAWMRSLRNDLEKKCPKWRNEDPLKTAQDLCEKPFGAQLK